MISLAATFEIMERESDIRVNQIKREIAIDDKMCKTDLCCQERYKAILIRRLSQKYVYRILWPFKSQLFCKEFRT